jgi:hypothetical protein
MERINMNRRHSQSYIGSVYTSDETYQSEIEAIRATVRGFNRSLKDYGTPNYWGDQLQYRVTLKARDPIVPSVNPLTGNAMRYDHYGDAVGGIKNAGRIDVYLHERRV